MFWAFIHPPTILRLGKTRACVPWASITANSRSRSNGAEEISCHAWLCACAVEWLTDCCIYVLRDRREDVTVTQSPAPAILTPAMVKTILPVLCNRNEVFVFGISKCANKSHAVSADPDTSFW